MILIKLPLRALIYALSWIAAWTFIWFVWKPIKFAYNKPAPENPNKFHDWLYS